MTDYKLLLCKYERAGYTWRLMNHSGTICESIPHSSEASCLRQADEVAKT